MSRIVTHWPVATVPECQLLPTTCHPERHHQVRTDHVLHALSCIGFPSILEPMGLDRGDSRKPDGTTPFHFRHGSCIIWDVGHGGGQFLRFPHHGMCPVSDFLGDFHLICLVLLFVSLSYLNYVYMVFTFLSYIFCIAYFNSSFQKQLYPTK